MQHLLEAHNIYKSFGLTSALKNVHFDLLPGEVHALVGENGAGKSTMMKIFSGVYQKDQGEIFFKGSKVEYTSPKEAIDLGIATIYQELNLCPHLSVMDNIFLNREEIKHGLLVRSTQAEKTIKILKSLNLDLDPYTLVKNIPIAKQQMVEIAKAISKESCVFIMDEPTSSLSEKEIDGLFETVKLLKSKGYGIIYISHRLEELSRIADRITVFRDGEYITTQDADKCNIDDIIGYMAGRNIEEKYPRLPTVRGQKRLEVKNLSNHPYFNDISFDVYEGEILGIAGLVGAGRTELAKGIFGVYGKNQGKLFLDGKELKIKNPAQAIAHGIAYIPEDRKTEGLALRLAIWENMVLPSSQAMSAFGFLKYKNIFKLVAEYSEKLQIKLASYFQKPQELSGGNQQKVVIAKWLAKNPSVIIFDEPTRGIDVNAKVSIYRIFQELKSTGIAVVVISSELQEIFGVSDRIMVMSSGKKTAELETKATSQEVVIKYATMFS